MPSRIVIIACMRQTLSALVASGVLLGCSPGSEAPRIQAEPPVTAPASPRPKPTGALPTAPAPRGLWVLAEGSQRVLEDVSKIDPLIENALAMGATDLFVQVYRGGRAWYDSDIADPAPFDALVARNGGDTLRTLLESAHEAGLRVHAWVNVLSLSLNRKAPILQALGPDVVLVDRRGRSILDDYPGLDVPPPDGDWYQMGTRGIYLDAAAPGVAERLVATFEELVLRYPKLDGLHLDYIRHPGALPFAPGSRFAVGLDFGYGAASRLRFRRETGLRGPYLDDSNPNPRRIVNADRWDDWRRQKLTDLVAEIRTSTLAIQPNLVISAAVNSYTDRAYLSLVQDWKRWLEEELIDLAIPMAYTKDDRLLRYQVRHFASAADNERIWAGLGVWLFASDPSRALTQIEIARSAGIAGDVLFSYDSILDSPALLAALSGATSGADTDPAEASDVVTPVNAPDTSGPTAPSAPTTETTPPGLPAP